MLPVTYAADVCKKIERESHEFKEEMVLCTMELVKDPQDTETKIQTDEQWTDLIDRGGLWHVKEMTYQFFIQYSLSSETLY